MLVVSALLDLLRPRLDFPTFEWLFTTLCELREPLDIRAFRWAFARAGRRLGSHPVKPTPEEAERLRGDAMLWPFSGWGADECGRAALLVRAIAVSPADTHLSLVDGVYMRGTIRERQAVLRILAWLPEPAQYVDIAAQACRSHVPGVFEAIALNNPYPFRYLPPPIFEQMVSKAVAIRVPHDRIVGAATRPVLDRSRSLVPIAAIGEWAAQP